MSLDERFQAAREVVEKLPKDGPLATSNDQKLVFYSFFKQSTEGDVKKDRPGIFSIVERKKWDAWKAIEGMSSDEAKKKYKNELNSIKKLNFRYVEALLEVFDNIDPSINVDEWLNGPNLDPCVKKNLAFLK